MPARKDFAPGEFCWIDFAAHDLEAAAKWYGDLMGWTHMMMPSEGPPYAFFLQGEHAIGGLGQMDDAMKSQGIPPMWNSYIATSDCEASEAKAKELGATVTVPTQEVPGFGKLAFIMDPEGASVAFWQSTSMEGPGFLVSEPAGLCWNELMSRDPNKASAFYKEIAGWDFADMPMGDIVYKMCKNDGKDAGGIFKMDGDQFEGIPAHWMVYFAVADCDATAEKAAATGGKVLVPPTDIPVGKFATLSDPQGGAFSVITMANPAG